MVMYLVTAGPSDRSNSSYQFFFLGCLIYPGGVLHRLLTEISNTSGRYIDMSTLAKICNASQTKREILALDKRLEEFLIAYLVRSESSAVVQQDVISPLD